MATEPYNLGLGFDVLELFERSSTVRLGITDVARELAIAKSSASDVCKAMADRGYLARWGNGPALEYGMGSRLQESWANAVMRSQEQLEKLRAEVDAQVRRQVGFLGTVATESRRAGEQRRWPARCLVCDASVLPGDYLCGDPACLAEWGKSHLGQLLKSGSRG